MAPSNHAQKSLKIFSSNLLYGGLKLKAKKFSPDSRDFDKRKI